MSYLTKLFEDTTAGQGILNDIKNFQSIRDLISHWMNTQSFIKKNRRKGKKIVGLCLPPCDLIYSFPNAVPILPLRLHLGTLEALSNADKYLKAAINEADESGCEPDQCVQVRTIYG
ncbi:MAG: hypothetical protein ACFFCM_19330, partial [Promethearchaeota archaeon]